MDSQILNSGIWKLLGAAGVGIAGFYLITFPYIGSGLMLLSILNKSTIPIFAPPQNSIAVQLPGVGPPQTLTIPKLGVNASVEQVGLDQNRAMDVPKNSDDAGWYNLGSKPGQVGNAVIDGHFDKVSGAPAVFYTINQLSPGDEIDVTDNLGNKFTYFVVDTKSYQYNQVPLSYVFGSTNLRRLNLITCSGTWDQGSKNYSQRTVVYSELKIN